MMIVAAWFVHCLVVAAVLSAAAVAWEVAARWAGRPTRWSWFAAMATSVSLPFVLRLLPARALSDAVPSAIPLVTLDPLALSAPASSGISGVGIGLTVWAVLSVCALGYIGLMMVQLVRARRTWREAEVDGDRVLVTRNLGPAAVGLGRARVVLPAWALELDTELRALLLRHEGEHVRAGDPRLLVAGLVLVAVMPWNPMLWLQVLRLRNSIELDCDVRVLAAGGDPKRYGSLLLEVGRRRGSSALVMATFSEPRMFLEERIRRIARWPVERRPLRAVLFATLGLALFAATLSARDPMRTAAMLEEIGPRANLYDAEGNLIAPRELAMVSDTPPRVLLQQMRERPRFTPMTKAPKLLNVDEVKNALAASYPPLLRNAGVGGTPVVWLFIDNTGKVVKTELSKPSGYAALDEAALNVATQMKFSPAVNGEEKVNVWVEVPVQFKTGDTLELREVPVNGRRLPPDAPPPPPAPPGAPTPTLVERPVAPPPVFTVAPELLNVAEVREALLRNYPPLLKDAGITGMVVMWIYLDENGRPAKTQIRQESGHKALDEAALRVVGTMRFSPALDNTTRVPRWIQFPLVFGAHKADGILRVNPDETVAIDALGTDPRTSIPVQFERRKDVPPPPPGVRAPAPPAMKVAVPDAPPPPPPAPDKVRSGDVSAAPTFTPMTVAPELLNIPDVRASLMRNYPPALRDAGIGGTPVLWFLIDENGNVQKLQISKRSGHTELDDAALRVGSSMKFKPALNGENRTKVWVEIPIQFKVN